MVEEIANDLFPRFEKMREEGKKVTVDFFDKYMQERGATFELSDSVMNVLIEMGFDFDTEQDRVEIEEPFLKKIQKIKNKQANHHISGFIFVFYRLLKEFFYKFYKFQ